MHLQSLALEGVFLATPRKKAARTFNWFRLDALAPTLPAGWFPSVGTMHMALPGEVVGLRCEQGYRVITCSSGRAALVVADLRVGTATFGRWIPLDFDLISRKTVVVPPGVVWGFQAVTSDAALLSLHRESPPGPLIDPQDPDLAIEWPLAVRDASGMALSEFLRGATGD